MPLSIYNTLSRQKELFEPIQPGRVHIYVCGPTVYDYPHIGHAKSYISFDVVVRYLRFLGYKVRYVQNITDVGHMLDSGEDRILKGAAREQIEPMELVEKYTRAYFAAMDALNVIRPDISPHASGHIPEQLDLVQSLLDKGCAYEVNGSVYFDVSRFAAYGKLSGRKVEEQKAGARLEVVEEKRHPADFALWKKADPSHIMKWRSPWGLGFPGWHLECSAMSMKYLGESLDIHGGGMENQFPHHECEIAQSESATGVPFVKYWMHNNMVLVDGVKMSKSLGNFTTIESALSRYSGDQIRFFILQSHYRSTVDFSDQAIRASAQGLEKLQAVYALLQASPAGATDEDGGAQVVADRYRRLFLEAMDDDFNTPAAIGHLFDYSREVNKYLSQAGEGASAGPLRAVFTDLYEMVLGLQAPAPSTTGLAAAPFIELFLDLRAALRTEKNWPLSDLIRDRLTELGVSVEDGKEGSRWRLVK